jgi:predicted MFS family arabinose efflux permease
MLLYVFPCLISIVSALASFVIIVLSVKQGASSMYIGCVGALFGLSYMLFNLAVSRLVTPQNARRMMVIGTLGLFLTCLLAAAFSALWFFVVLAILFNAWFALFFQPFQIFMKLKDEGGRGLACAAGLYTASWSIGFGIGPSIAGFLIDHASWRIAYLAAAAIPLSTALVFGLLFDDQSAPLSGRIGPVTAPPADPARSPDLAPAAWIGAFLGVMTYAFLRISFPQKGLGLGLSSFTVGLVLGLQGIMQGLVNLAFIKHHRWIDTVVYPVLWGALGITGLLVLALAQHTPWFLAAAFVFSFYTGSIYFYLVIHALRHPTRSVGYVARNEFVIGAAWTAGPLLGGMLAVGHADRPYLAGAGLVALALIIQTMIITVRKKCCSLPIPPAGQ